MKDGHISDIGHYQDLVDKIGTDAAFLKNYITVQTDNSTDKGLVTIYSVSSFHLHM